MRIYPVLKKKKIKKTKFVFDSSRVKITRAGLSSNPVQRLNYVGGDIFNNDALVRHGDNFFIGGDTATFEFDLSTKVAGSVAECPCRVSVSQDVDLANLPNPTTFVWGETDQATYDYFKSQDGSYNTASTNVSGKGKARIIEVDMTRICNDFFGGSNSAFKSAMASKNINVDLWALASGANGGVNTYGLQAKLWGDYWNSWAGGTNDRQNSSSSSVTKVTLKNDSTSNNPFATPDKYITSSNKIYILIASQYASDGTIPSSVSLDYIKVSVDISRNVDTVQPISVNLPKYFAVVGGFSPCWDNTYAVKNSRILELYKDANNLFRLFWDSSGKKISVNKIVNGVLTSVSQTSASFLKNQVYKFAVGQNASGMFMYLLKNNGTLEKYTNTDVTLLAGLMQLYEMQRNDNTNQSDAFADTFNLIDSTGKPSGYTDAEWTAILNGTATGWENRELFDINAVSLHANAVRSNGVITLNATGAYQTSIVEIPVLPNNRYELKAIVSSANNRIDCTQLYNNIVVQNQTIVISNTVNTVNITTTANCNKLRLHLNNTAAGTFTFSGISLKRKD